MNDVSGLNGWALIEVFGHTRLAGKISEESLGGSSLLRVDVPDEDGGTKMTKFLGVASIFSITMTTEEIARKAARSIDAAPISVYELTRIELESIRERAEAMHKRETERPAIPERIYRHADGEVADDIPFEGRAMELYENPDDLGENAIDDSTRRCRVCGCTDDNCSQCIDKTGRPCYWIEKDLCSACHDEQLRDLVEGRR